MEEAGEEGGTWMRYDERKAKGENCGFSAGAVRHRQPFGSRCVKRSNADFWVIFQLRQGSNIHLLIVHLSHTFSVCNSWTYS